MSLLSYASPWNNNDRPSESSNPSRKRVPTMTQARKTIKARPNSVQSDDLEDNLYTPVGGSRSDQKPETIDEVLSKQTEKNTHINSIIHQITSFSNDDRLGDFNPMPYPTTVGRKNSDQTVPADESPKTPDNPLLPKSAVPASFMASSTAVPSNGLYYRPSEPSSSGSYASYREAYQNKEGHKGKEPYYSKMGIGGSSGDKVMDRLNYMTQMLESLQMERTNHVTEEFALYALLGVFMIYIVDGFSKNGKYVR